MKINKNKEVDEMLDYEELKLLEEITNYIKKSKYNFRLKFDLTNINKVIEKGNLELKNFEHLSKIKQLEFTEQENLKYDLVDVECLIKEKFNLTMLLELDERVGLDILKQIEDKKANLRKTSYSYSVEERRF